MDVEIEFHAVYALMVLLGLLLLAAFRPTVTYTPSEKRKYYQLQLLTLIGALVGAKVAVLLGDAEWPLKPFNDWQQLLISGRSIMGALLFGFLVAEGMKPLLGYTLPPNDRFAIALPFSIGVGRLGCWMAGCCLGIPMDSSLAVVGVDGVPRFPAPLIESAFHLMAGFVLVALWRRRILAGRLFALYLVAYGVFRFGTEFLRVTPKSFSGLSAYQWLCLIMMFSGGLALYLRRDRQTSTSTPLPVLP